MDMSSGVIGPIRLWSIRVAGGALVVTGAVLAVLGYIIMRLLGIMLTKRGPDYPPPGDAARFCIEQPWWIVGAALPAIVCGVLLVRYKAKPVLMWIGLGLLLVIVPLAMILYCFIAVISPLYQMQPL
jgi:hypothetical protein